MQNAQPRLKAHADLEWPIRSAASRKNGSIEVRDRGNRGVGQQGNIPVAQNGGDFRELDLPPYFSANIEEESRQLEFSGSAITLVLSP